MKSATEVLIVGAGPTGLMLALELARQKINFRIIDKKSETSQHIKATAISSVALEGFDDFDYATPFIKTGNATHALVVYAENKLITHAPWVGIESKYPCYFLIGQNYVEKFQEQLLKQLGAHVEWGVELKNYVDKENFIEASVQGQQTELIHCNYLIGCDGSHSVVRQKGNFVSKGKEYPSHYMVADIVVHGDFNPGHWYFFLAKTGFASISGLPDNRWGVLVSLPKTEVYEKGRQPTLEELQQYFDELSPIPGQLSDPRWISHFHTYRKSVNTRQKGRVILCGDAAHQVSPLTSLGMNSGLLDARNLGWKLALECQGVAAKGLLESYSKEQEQTIKPAKLLSDMNEQSFSMTGIISREYRDHLTELMMQLEPAQKYFGGLLSQTKIRMTKSPIVDEFIGLPIHWSSTQHLSENSSCLLAWAEFGKGPRAGERAPNMYAATTSQQGTTQWLFEKRLAGKHGLFIFLTSNNPSEDLKKTVHELLENIKMQYGSWINSYLVVDKESTIENTGLAEIIVDKDNKIHERYGAAGECLYLIRPDQFVGFRSIPLRWDKLQSYLQTIFKR
ncbi:hypothetical protein A8135_09785 [Legionella jamestowniensis]|uniref:Alkyl hydroperoxide reductase subunit F n=1 Tax=Legionella jamestowniensis TaxID=455 RepID=A0ABX2XXT9_9GAMM|nr:FAD-dependent monooxygenase [Legionella jamestowniensis]OCH99026.1 hypothetical protein A8135_09785 [Legionella jamestowniensis]